MPKPLSEKIKELISECQEKILSTYRKELSRRAFLTRL